MDFLGSRDGRDEHAIGSMGVVYYVYLRLFKYING